MGTAARLWIKSPAYDLIFFSAWWFLPAIWAFHQLSSIWIASLVFILYHWLLRLPHFVATAPVTYFNRENRVYYRKRWIRFYAIPAAILVVYSLPTWLQVSDDVHRILLTIFLLWGLQHIAMQNYGITCLYRMREERKGDRWRARIEKGAFYLLMAGSAIAQLTPIWFASSGKWVLQAVLLLQLGAAALLLSLWVREIKGGWASAPTWIYLASAVVTMIYWPFYQELGPAGQVLYFYVYNGHHCLVYLGLVAFVDGKAQTLGSRLRFIVPLWLVSGVLIALVLRSIWPTATQVIEHSTFRSLEALWGLFVAHYYLESVAWKFGDEHVRKILLPKFMATKFLKKKSLAVIRF